MSEKYVELSWSPEDVRTLAPKMTLEEATAWLQRNQKHIRDRLCELGWTVISSLLAHDGVDTAVSDEDDEQTNGCWVDGVRVE